MQRADIDTAKGAPGIPSLLMKPVLVGSLLFFFAFAVYLISPVHQVTDSHYTMLLSQSLIDHQSFRLDRYFQFPLDPQRYPTADTNRYPMHIQEVAGHLYYFYPPGSSIVSIPFVIVGNWFGISAVRDEILYDPYGELILQVVIAAFTTAALVAVLYWTAQLVLPLGWSILLALTAAFGTPLFSTASRALWSMTEETLLIGIAIFILFSHATKGRPLRPLLFGSLLAWMYFIRPTAAISILGLGGCLLLLNRRAVLPAFMAFTFWAGTFVLYSWVHFHQILPNRYQAALTHEGLPIAFAGNLISPSRGLLVYCPILLFVFYLLLRYRTSIRYPTFLVVALPVIILHLIAVSSVPPSWGWWAGYSYGPRFSTELVPWFFVLAVVAVDAMRQGRQPHLTFALRFTGVVLLTLSLLMHINGAFNRASWAWNTNPANINTHPERAWDWKDPQFLRR